MNPKYKGHEPKKLPVYPVVMRIIHHNRIQRKLKLFAPLLSRAEKETVKHLSQHDRVVYLRAMRLGITVAEYKLNYCQ